MVDILNAFPGWTIRFEPLHRKDQSRHASGRTRTKNLGDMIWVGEWRTKSLLPNAADKWKSILGALENTDGTFDGYSTSRVRPILHPLRAYVADVPAGPITVNVVGGDNASFTLSGAAGLHLTVGDMIQLKGVDLYRVDNTSDNGASVKVTPQLWPGTVSGNAVKILKPSCLMTVVPGSVQTTAGLDGRVTVSWQGIEARG